MSQQYLCHQNLQNTKRFHSIQVNRTARWKKDAGCNRLPEVRQPIASPFGVRCAILFTYPLLQSGTRQPLFGPTVPVKSAFTLPQSASGTSQAVAFKRKQFAAPGKPVQSVGSHSWKLWANISQSPSACEEMDIYYALWTESIDEKMWTDLSGLKFLNSPFHET